MNNYENESRERWSETAAYREHEQKTKNYTKEKWAEVNDGLMAIFAEFAACKDSGASADSAEAQGLVAKLQSHITANYYTCTDEILAGLGKMYVADERFKKNIDKYGETQLHPLLFERILLTAFLSNQKATRQFA